LLLRTILCSLESNSRGAIIVQAWVPSPLVSSSSLKRTCLVNERTKCSSLQRPPAQSSRHVSSETTAWALHMVTPRDREAEIRRKIAMLKRQGRLKKESSVPFDDDDDDDDEEDESLPSASARNSPADDVYTSKIRQKLGDKKSKLLGYVSSEDGDDGDSLLDITNRKNQTATLAEASSNITATITTTIQQQRRPQLGSIQRPVMESVEEDEPLNYTPPPSSSTKSSSKTVKSTFIDPDLIDDDDEEPAMSEEDLMELVEQKWLEKRRKEIEEREAESKETLRLKLEELAREREAASSSPVKEVLSTDSQRTSGVGGLWNKTSATQEAVEMYQPTVGTWGAFPRPKDISKAYGGGRRVD
jgi:hypothetical protein